MATFTLRVPDVMAGRLDSAQMRSWLSDFLQYPHALPPDPGSGYERVCLTLPKEMVRDASGYLRCSPSASLRRLAAERLGTCPAVAQVSTAAPKPSFVGLGRVASPSPIRYPASDARHDKSPISQASEAGAALLMEILILVLVFGTLAFLRWRERKAA
jgi:hypothetical protein